MVSRIGLEGGARPSWGEKGPVALAARKRIALIAKDLAEALEAFLGSLPAQPMVQRVGSLLEFLEIPRTVPVDLLFLDADILEAGDVALVRRILAVRPEIRALVSFSQGGAEAAREIRAMGALPVWKPYLLGELYSSVPQLLRTLPHRIEEGAALPGADLIGGLADELNNPLATISGHLQLLSLDVEKAQPQETAEKLSAIREGIERIASTVEQLVLAGGGRKPRKSPLDLLALLRERVKKRKVRHPKISFPPEPPKVPEALADPKLFGSAFDGLLQFFAETVPEGGDCRVSIPSAIPQGRTGLLFRCPRGRLSEEMVGCLFEPYAPGIPGGLRLAAVRGILATHGGEIHARAHEEGFLEIAILLPSA